MNKRLVISIGDQLKSARIKLKMSQYEVAQRAGLRPEVISRLETGKSGASLASLHKLAPVLGFSLDELVASSTAPKPGVAKPAVPPAPKKGKKT